MKRLKFELTFEVPDVVCTTEVAEFIDAAINPDLPSYYDLTRRLLVSDGQQETYTHTVWNKTDRSGCKEWAAVPTPNHQKPVEIQVPIDWGLTFDGEDGDSTVYDLYFRHAEQRVNFSIEDAVRGELSRFSDELARARGTSTANQPTETTPAPPEPETYAWTVWKSIEGIEPDYSLFEDEDYNAPITVQVPRGWKPSPNGSWDELSNWSFIDGKGGMCGAGDAVAGNWKPKLKTTVTVYVYYGDSGSLRVQVRPLADATRFDIEIPVKMLDLGATQHFVYGLQTRQIKLAPYFPLPV